VTKCYVHSIVQAHEAEPPVAGILVSVMPS
jgi:hypothetical protein